MSKLKSLSFQIVVNRQRLQYALESQNDSLIHRTSFVLAELHAVYFDETQRDVFMKTNQVETKFLVFCEAYPDGRVLSRTAYSSLMRRMDECDLNSHVAVEVDAELSDLGVEALEQQLLVKTEKNKAG